MSETPRPSVERYIHEAFFSLNLAFTLMAFTFADLPERFHWPLFRLEFFVNRLLHIRQTDAITGYWMFFLPGTALAACLWLLLRAYSGTRLISVSLRAAAGLLAVGAAPCFFLSPPYPYYGIGLGYVWKLLLDIRFYELLAALCCVVLYLRRKWRVPAWGSILLLFGHHAFWIWQFRGSLYLFLQGWGAPFAVAPIVGLCSGLAWMLYRASLKEERRPTQG